jgi:metal-dependent HD superfamily phosphatase/phosphodiesterase
VVKTIEEPHLPVTFDQLKDHPSIHALIRAADEALGAQGYTEHGFRHAGLVAHIAHNILVRLDRPERQAHLAAIAGYLHDIGNVVNRFDHATSGALLAKDILLSQGLRWDDLAVVMGAIGNHEERIGEPVSDASAAVIIADKSDVHRTRVRNTNPLTFDVHDRVNYAAQRSFVRVNEQDRTLTLELTIDTSQASLADYFNIFSSRMMFIKRSCDFLGVQFRLEINQTRII